MGRKRSMRAFLARGPGPRPKKPASGGAVAQLDAAFLPKLAAQSGIDPHVVQPGQYQLFERLQSDGDRFGVREVAVSFGYWDLEDRTIPQPHAFGEAEERWECL